jgi:hypothetical protein
MYGYHEVRSNSSNVGMDMDTAADFGSPTVIVEPDPEARSFNHRLPFLDIIGSDLSRKPPFCPCPDFLETQYFSRPAKGSRGNACEACCVLNEGNRDEDFDTPRSARLFCRRSAYLTLPIIQTFQCIQCLRLHSQSIQRKDALYLLHPLYAPARSC